MKNLGYNQNYKNSFHFKFIIEFIHIVLFCFVISNNNLYVINILMFISLKKKLINTMKKKIIIINNN